MPTNDHLPIDLDALVREDLWTLAQTWRRRALRGDRTARGAAHACEVVYRRRFGPPTVAAPLQDRRPLAVLAPSVRGRSFWLWT